MTDTQNHAAIVDKSGNAVSLQAPLKLHIGGKEKRDGWYIFDSLDSDVVDFIGECSDLSLFPDRSCKAVYCSHVLEHLSHNGELHKTLRGIRRVLQPGGKLMISVPDLDVLCRLFIRPDIDFKQRSFVMWMMFGGQVDPYDFHKTGLNFDLLMQNLASAGFHDASKIKSFGLFNDSSEKTYLDELVSLNVVATA